MRKLIALLSVLCMASATTARQRDTKLFPYNYTIDDLANGLRLVTVPTDFPNMVALYIVVQTGSRNEVEPGKSGYAHLFEHIMFRGSENYTPEQRDLILKKAGAEANATTNSDRTTYYETFSKEDLEPVMKLEGDRFQRLKYPVPAYKTESLAVLGEYNKNSADPTEKLDEVLHETAFTTHTYRHTTMGFLKDIQDMPNQYDDYPGWGPHARTCSGADEEIFWRVEARELCAEHPRRTASDRATHCDCGLELTDASVAGHCVQSAGVFGREEGQSRARFAVADRIRLEFRFVSTVGSEGAKSR